MKLSISNIAWTKENDKEMYEYLSKSKFDGVEIAATRIIENEPYLHIDEAEKIAKELKYIHNLEISSMQSIWYGRQEKIFSNDIEREKLLDYTKMAIDFASAIHCGNLVFGCPKNRIIEDIQKDYKIALEFFRKIGEYAKNKDTCFAIEPNPTIYNTNFITTTEEAIKIVKEINNSAIKINLDIGTMIYNKEDINILRNNVNLINHVHISEPNLETIQKRKLHLDLIKLLKENNYDGYISIEMKNQNNIQNVKDVMSYVSHIVKESSV